MKEIRSASFDTSFLLKKDPNVDKVLKELKRDGVPCYLTSTVVSELEQLRRWERIEENMYKKAISRWKRVGGQLIDFKNRLLSADFKRHCIDSMGTYHGVKPQDIINDCNILVVSLKKGIDLFLSEDFHFTSKITISVIDEVTNAACTEYHQMCDEEMYCIDAKTFLEAYTNSRINVDIIESMVQNIIKPGKLLNKQKLP